MNYSTKGVKKSTKTVADYYVGELERISETSSAITYYFENSDTNALKNVIISKITSTYPTYHNHDFFEINYCLKGRLYERVGGKSLTLEEGDLLFMSPNIYHTCYCQEDTSCYNMLIKASWLQGVAKNFERYDPGNYLTSLINNGIYTIISKNEHSPALSELFNRIKEQSRKLVHHVDLYENLAVENHAAEFLLALTKCQRHEYSGISGKAKKSENYTPDDLVRYINDNFDKINLSDTAARFGYSRSQFHRIIKKKTGFSFTELILKMRMQRARHYLLNTNMPIKNIAYLLGLDSAEHFTRMFKKNRGMTPKEYRNQYMRGSIKNKTV